MGWNKKSKYVCEYSYVNQVPGTSYIHIIYMYDIISVFVSVFFSFQSAMRDQSSSYYSCYTLSDGKEKNNPNEYIYII